MANVHGGNVHHPDTEAIKGRCISTNVCPSAYTGAILSIRIQLQYTIGLTRELYAFCFVLYRYHSTGVLES